MDGRNGRNSASRGADSAGRAATQSLCSRTELLVGIAFVALLTGIFFAPLLTGKTSSSIPSARGLAAPWADGPPDAYPQSDQAQFFYPSTVLQTEAWRDGTIPLWNPYNLAGLPILTNGQSGVLYPPRIALALVTSPSVNHDLFMLLHLFGAGVGMFLLLKEFRLRLAAALLGAAGWMFAGYNTGLMQVEAVLPIATWLPVALLLIHRMFATRSWRMAVAAGVPLGLMALGGQLQLVAIAVSICAAYAAALALAPLVRQRTRSQFTAWRIAYPALTLVVAGGLGAATLLATALVLGEGGREVPPYDAFLVTHTLSFEAFDHIFSGGPPTAATLLFNGVFVGLVPLALAVVGVVRRRPGAALGRWLVFATLLFAIGAPVVTWIAYHLVPGVSRLSSTGYVLWAFSFGVVLLGAIGLDALLEWSEQLAERLSSPRARDHRRRRLRAGVLVAAPVVAILAIAGTSWQLIRYARYINPPFVERDGGQLFTATPAIDALRLDQAVRTARDPQRVIGFRALPANESAVFSIESLDGYDSVVFQRVRVLMSVIAGASVDDALLRQHYEALGGFASGRSASFVTGFSAPSTRFDLLGRSGVTTIIASLDDARWIDANPDAIAPVRLTKVYDGADAVVYTLDGGHPRAWVVHDARVVGSPEEAVRFVTRPDHDARTAMVVESEEGIGTPGDVVHRGDGDGVSARRDDLSLNRTAFSVTSSSPGWLVMADTYAPGWTVRVNGEEAELLRANYTQRAVAIPSGRSRVELEYRPPGFTIGLVISLLTLLSCLGVGALAVVRRRSRAATRIGPPTTDGPAPGARVEELAR